MPKNFFRRFAKNFFIVTNCIVAILFLLGCYGYWFNPEYFWPLGFLTLSAFYFLLILLLFLLAWLFAKSRLSLISAVAILLAYKPVLNIIPFRITNSFSQQKPKNTLRVMSWNVAQFDALHSIKHPEIKDQMISLINEYQPDIACFQEMVCEDSAVIKHGHVSEYLQRLNFADYFYSYNRKDDFFLNMPISV